jgi:hypothetical protein
MYGKCGVRYKTQWSFVFVVTSTCSKSFSHTHLPCLSFYFQLQSYKSTCYYKPSSSTTPSPTCCIDSAKFNETLLEKIEGSISVEVFLYLICYINFFGDFVACIMCWLFYFLTCYFFSNIF